MEPPEEDEGWRLLAIRPSAQEKGHAQAGCLLQEGSEECPGGGRKKLRAPLDSKDAANWGEGWDFGQYLGVRL